MQNNYNKIIINQDFSIQNKINNNTFKVKNKF